MLATPLTFEAANFAVLANGLRLRWVDVDPGSFNIDLDDLPRKISPATVAISLVHWAGYPVDLDRLSQILDGAAAAHGYRPLVIEDCAHAWGTTLRGRRLGNHGNVGIFSFVEGVLRWHNRVAGYAFTLVTDQYPPFRLKP